MRRRSFLGIGALGLAGVASGCATSSTGSIAGPPLLTVSGAIGEGNRGASDEAFDAVFTRHGIAFERAHAFDFGALAALPAVTIEPTLEYDAQRHRLRGPLLTDVLDQAGVPLTDGTALSLRALDGYAVTLTIREARQYRYLVATHLDDRPMPLGGLGPLWAVFEADRFADVAARPLGERFVRAPWGLYHIGVAA